MSPSNPSESTAFPWTPVSEEARDLAGVPVLVHPGWSDDFGWLVQGTTRRPWDLGLFGDASSPRTVLDRWERLGAAAGAVTVVHARQVHGATVRHHRSMAPGLHLCAPCDGHATADAGVVLAVTTADCVPVSIVDPEARAVALVHAGWRGGAAGVVERGVAVLAERVGSRPGALRVHLGPAICGACYEVGPEVFGALGLRVPTEPSLLDLRAALAVRAEALGVPSRSITVSRHCTRCGEAGLFSHRGGDAARQVGFIGVRG